MHHKKLKDVEDTYCATTRKELLWFLWNEGITDFNIFKEGARYAVQIGKTIYSTPARNLHSFPVAWWARCIRKQYFPI